MKAHLLCEANQQSHDHSHHTLVLDICHQTKQNSQVVSMFPKRKKLEKGFIVSSLAVMSARGLLPGAKLQMHGVTWKWRSIAQSSAQNKRFTLACRPPAASAPGDTCALCVSHAQTARQIQTRVEEPEEGLGERPPAARRAYVIRSFLLSLHGGDWAWGSGWSPPWVPFFLRGPPGRVQVFCCG